MGASTKKLCKYIPLTNDGVNVCHQITGAPKFNFSLTHEKCVKIL